MHGYPWEKYIERRNEDTVGQKVHQREQTEDNLSVQAPLTSCRLWAVFSLRVFSAVIRYLCHLLERQSYNFLCKVFIKVQK